MLADERLDIVAICVRGPHHFAVTRDVLATSCRAVFLEKPPTCSLHELDELLRLARAKSVPIIGSYSRHWAPHVLRLQELVAGGLIGDVRSVVGYCGGLFLSFASHTTDLICQFAGYTPLTVIARGAADRTRNAASSHIFMRAPSRGDSPTPTQSGRSGERAAPACPRALVPRRR